MERESAFLRTFCGLSRSLGLVNDILHLTTKLQRNLNSQSSEMPKFWLAAVTTSAILFFAFL
jgi:hypothetical protein